MGSNKNAILSLRRKSQHPIYPYCSLLRSKTVPLHALYPEQRQPPEQAISYYSALSHTDLSRILICLPRSPTSSPMVRPALHLRFDPWTQLPAAATGDAHFSPSLKGGGSGAVYVLDPSMPVGFAVGD